MKWLRRRDFLRTGLAAATVGAGGRIWGRQIGDRRPTSAPPVSGWAQLPAILASIVPPQFPDRDFVITDYGAPTHFGADCNPALNAAIQACHDAGGGRVVVPAGAWLSNGPIRLLSHVNLYLEAGATIIFGTDPKHYLPVQLVRWQGVRCYNYSPLIHAYQQRDIAITGSGTINGRGLIWNAWTNKQGPDWRSLQKMAQDLVPVEDRVFGAGHYLRPALFEPYDCANILVQGVTLVGSPFWTIHPTFCSNVTIQEVTVHSGAQNDDGCDPDSCLNVLIEGCNFSTVDDNVSIKAGLNPDAQGLPGCENIVIQGCNCLRSTWSGLTIGSGVGGFVRNVFIENCTVDRCLSAHFIKGEANSGGGVENVYIRSNRVLACDSLLTLQPDSYANPGTMGPPLFSNINMQDVTCNRALGPAFVFAGDPSLPIEDVNLSSVVIEKTVKAASISNTLDLTATDIVVNGQPVDITG
ncbi:MAG: glycoside hydrolase family 28 protein [Terracidiphilus sp.]